MPATGTIARTVTNVKNGATTPVAGVVHALTLLAIILVAAPLASHIPLAALSAILMFVAWNMGEWREFVHLRQFRLPYRVTLLAVFLLTVIVDLTVAVEVGLIAACLTFIYRISNLTRSEAVTPQTHPILQGQAPGVKAYRLYGALFFGAVKLVEAMEDDLPERTLVLDLKNLIYVDSSGADALMALVRTCHKRQLRLILCGLAHQPLDLARRSGLLEAVPEADRPDDLAAGLALACQA
jgi:SulP family sulfate permease